MYDKKKYIKNHILSKAPENRIDLQVQLQRGEYEGIWVPGKVNVIHIDGVNIHTLDADLSQFKTPLGVNKWIRGKTKFKNLSYWRYTNE